MADQNASANSTAWLTVPPNPGEENMSIESLEQRLRQTVARGYCDDKNCNKELDSDLLNSIVHEIMLSLAPDCHPDRRLPLVRESA